MTAAKPGRGFVLVLRYLMALFYTGAAITGGARTICSATSCSECSRTACRRSTRSPSAPGSSSIGIPHYVPLAWMVCWGRNLHRPRPAVRLHDARRRLGGILMFLSTAAGGYYDASLIALALMFLPFVLLPTGHWFGLIGACTHAIPRRSGSAEGRGARSASGHRVSRRT
ncbi:MAG: hypothetical protein U1F11_14965 [Steroidobacteraceae bacterium]